MEKVRKNFIGILTLTVILCFLSGVQARKRRRLSNFLTFASIKSRM